MRNQALALAAVALVSLSGCAGGPNWALMSHKFDQGWTSQQIDSVSRGPCGSVRSRTRTVTPHQQEVVLPPATHGFIEPAPIRSRPTESVDVSPPLPPAASELPENPASTLEPPPAKGPFAPGSLRSNGEPQKRARWTARRE